MLSNTGIVITYQCLLAWLILCSGCTSSQKHEDCQVNGGFPCAVCTVFTSLLEQYIEIHNTTADKMIEVICNIFSRELQPHCQDALNVLGPVLIELFERKETSDVICHVLNFCYTKNGQEPCHLFPLPETNMPKYASVLREYILKKHKPIKLSIFRNYFFETLIQESINIFIMPVHYLLCRSMSMAYGTHISNNEQIFKQNLSPCHIPGINQICKWVEKIIMNHEPVFDADNDLFSMHPTYRGYTWRGKDCNDNNNTIYPGRRPLNNDIHMDSNCNGIYGIDPKTGKSYEEKFCSSSHSRGFVIAGDSITAHFHFPTQWLIATNLTKEILSNLSYVISNEINWPHLSYATGYVNISWPIENGPTDSVYLKLRERNRCIHRDYQNLAVNGAKSFDFTNIHTRLHRKKTDLPVLFFYALQGNDVCNCHDNNSIHYMTTPSAFHDNVMKTLIELDEMLPVGSHVLLIELINASFLYDVLADRLYPLGYLHKDLTYKNVFKWFNCLWIGPCAGWQNSNATLRKLTSERAIALSAQLKLISLKYKFKSFDVHYIKNPVQRLIKEWISEGYEIWQLIELADGLHPNQVAQSKIAKVLWQEILETCPEVLGPVNPHNNEISKIFGDQDGY